MNETVRYCRRITAAAATRPTRSRRKTLRPLSSAHVVLRRPPTARDIARGLRNAASRARIAEIAGGQFIDSAGSVFIAVVVDLYRRLGRRESGGEQVFQVALKDLGRSQRCRYRDGDAHDCSTRIGSRRRPIGEFAATRRPYRSAPLPPNTFGGWGRAWLRCRRVVTKARMAIESFRHEKHISRSAKPAIDAYDGPFRSIGRILAPTAVMVGIWRCTTAGFAIDSLSPKSKLHNRGVVI